MKLLALYQKSPRRFYRRSVVFAVPTSALYELSVSCSVYARSKAKRVATFGRVDSSLEIRENTGRRLQRLSELI